MDDFINQRIGRVLGERWTLRSVLGVGGMAAVYAATDPSGAEAAVKVLHPEIGMRPEIRDRFMREGYIANRIGHPGAVRVLEHGTIDEWSVFLVMERLSGESLGDRLKRHGTLPIQELLDVLDQVLDVLAVAHDAGIVHRDLKPDNLFVTTNGTIKVLDFGLARVLDGAPNDVRTRTGIAMGTLPYMAPEQALGKRSEIDGRVDIFAMGATAFRILSKRRIHEADSDAGMLLAMASQAAPPLRSVAPAVPEHVASIVDLALAFNRDARYPDARSMQADVRAVRSGKPPSFVIERMRSRDQATRPGTHVVARPVAAAAAMPPVNATPSPVSQLATVVGAPPGQAPTVVIGQRAPEPPTVVAPPRVAPPPTVVVRAASLPAATVSAVPAVGRAPARSRLPVILLASALLLGAAVWMLWPDTKTNAAASEVDEDSTDQASEAARTESGAQQDRNAFREVEKKQRELARERQKKMAEFARERAKKSAEERREKGKR